MRFRVAWNRRPVKSAGSCWNDIYEFSVVRAASAECHYAVSLGKNSVVLANTGIYTRVETCSSLAHDDVAGQHSFATELLYAESFGFRIASVSSTTACFLMCHDLCLVLLLFAG